MSLIGQYDITGVIQNQAFSSVSTWTYTNDDVPPVDVPLDLSIYTEIYFDVFYNCKRIVRKTLLDGITVTGANDNILTINLTQEDTLLFKWEELNHELRMVNASEENNYLLKGTVTVKLTKSR
jgi:hypothetical protein